MKRDETLCLRSLWAFGTEGNHLTPREAELGLLKVGKYALRSGGLSSPNSVRVQICTRTDRGSTTLKCVRVQICTRTDSEVYESEMCTRTYLYAYRSGQRSTNSDGSQQVFSQDQVLRKNVRVRICTRTDFSTTNQVTTTIKRMVSQTINKTF